MVFSSFHFVYGFLPIFLVAYYLLPKKNLTILFFSLLFYSWGNPKILILLVLASLFDFIISPFLIQKNGKMVLIFGLIINLGFLFYYKYTNFFIAQLNSLNLVDITWKDIVLPAGISFFTFEKISYLIDVYKKKVPPADSFLDYLLFVSLFPHLIAGPVLKYSDLASQIKSRNNSLNNISEGFIRFCFGLGKKLLIADEVAKIADTIFNISPYELNATYAWLGILCYAIQIYFDFSGYSDMAIGLAKMAGFNFIENFNLPYLAKNITDFWKRWHISLTNWIKEYLYIPLGGSRTGILRSYINLVIVFFLSGIWHGASWNFILWGIFHGLFLVCDRVFWINISNKIPNSINIFINFIIVCLGWVLFRSKDLSQSFGMYYNLFLGDWELSLNNYFPAQLYSNRSLSMLLLGLFIVFILPKFKFKIPELIKFSFAIVLLFLSTMSMTESSSHPFLYFQF